MEGSIHSKKDTPTRMSHHTDVMASSESLFNLVDQLQHLESTVTNLIFEMALKLSSLTSSNVFVMVESNLGRKYAGKPHLCAEYATTGLKPLHGDVKVDFDPQTGSLKEYPSSTPHSTFNAVQDNVENTFFHRDSSSLTSPPSNKKRRHGTRDSASLNDKRRRGNDPSLDAASVTQNSVDCDSFGRTEDLLQIAKIESEDFVDDDVLIEEFTLDDTVKDDGALLVEADSESSSRANRQRRNQQSSEGSMFSCSLDSRRAEVSFLSGDVDSYFQSNDKVAALRTLAFDVTGAEVNASTPAFKIMTSVLYDVAKMASGTSPTRDKRDPHARAHFDKHFDRIMIEFPQLRALTDQGVKVKTAGLGSFVRSTMQKTFGKLLDKAMQADLAKSNDNGNVTTNALLRSPLSNALSSMS